MTRTIILLFLVTACTVPQTSETRDSVAVLSEDTLAVEPANDENDPAIDTVFNEIAFDKKFNTPQFNRKIAYIYQGAGLDVYSKLDENFQPLDKVGHIDFRQPVKLQNDLVNSAPASQSELYDMRGNYVPFEFEGKTAYIFSGYLLNLPVPNTQDVIEYFSTTLQVLEPVIERKSPENAGDAEFLLVNYKFEGGFKIFHRGYYEGGGIQVTLPDFSAQEAYLFAWYFYESFRNHIPEFPSEAVDKDLPEAGHISIVFDDNGNLDVITIGNGDGCYWEDTIERNVNGFFTMSSQGGC